MPDLRTKVLIVGAGPTGLMAANQLKRFGIDFLIVDPKERPTHESRAIAVTARSLEIYQQLGLSENVLENGKKIVSFNVYSSGKIKADVRVGELGKNLSEFSYMLAFEQSKNETLLAENLKKQDVDVLWKNEFLHLEKYDTEIQALVKNESGTYTIYADYIIGCDGARSPIRHQLNFSFKGGTYENKFFVADTKIKWDLSYDRLLIAPSKENFCAFLPLKGDDTYRVIGTLPRSYRHRDNVTFRDIEQVVINTLGIPLVFQSIHWFSIYKLHHRKVEQFNKGRVFLAGDSAHIHSPAGGQGMNTGLQDAYNLAWKMAFVLKGYASGKLLDTYNEERLPFARRLLKFSDRGFTMMTNQHWFIRFVRKYIFLNLIGSIVQWNWVRPLLFKSLSQIDISYRNFSLAFQNSGKFKFRSGDRLPFLKQPDSDTSIYTLFRTNSFHFLHVGNQKMSTSLQSQISALCPFPVQFVELPWTDSWQRLGVKKELFALVRPDNYLSFVGDNFNDSEFSNCIRRICDR